MYVIIAYDVAEKRVAKVHKILRKYLQWTQNSLFEGEITDSLLKQCLSEIAQKANPDVDSIYIYKIKNPKNLKKEVYGIEKDFEEMFF